MIELSFKTLEFFPQKSIQVRKDIAPQNSYHQGSRKKRGVEKGIQT